MHARCRNYAGTILVAEHEKAIAGLVMVLTRVPFELDEPPGDYALVAELVVMDRDLFESDEPIDDGRVVATIVGGVLWCAS